MKKQTNKILTKNSDLEKNQSAERHKQKETKHKQTNKQKKKQNTKKQRLEKESMRRNTCCHCQPFFFFLFPPAFKIQILTRTCFETKIRKKCQ
jgi:hypothetical protein